MRLHFGVAATIVALSVGGGSHAMQTPSVLTAAPSNSRSLDDSDSAYIRANYEKRELLIPMRDGVRLFTAVYSPRDASPSKRYPLLLVRTPFSVAPYGSGTYPAHLGPNRFMMREGYIVVAQDVRGRYRSEGTFENVRSLRSKAAMRDRRSTDEATDTYDTIEWLLANTRVHNGRVGQWGISYGGFYAALGMLSGHPALVASSPQAPVADFFFEDLHHNGALTQGAFSAYPVFGVPRPAPTSTHWWLPEYLKVASYGEGNDYASQLALGPIGTLTSRWYRQNSLWQDIIAHPNYDAFWRARAVPSAIRGVRHAVLVVGGWFDAENLHGPLAVYRALRAQSPLAQTTLVMGPFGHRGWTADDEHTTHGDLYFGDSLATRFQRDVEAVFFRHWLKGPANGAPELPVALVFDTGANRWKRLARWPGDVARTQDWYFHADGALSTTAPSDDVAFREYPSDPAHPVPSRCRGQTIEDGKLDRYMSDDQRCFVTRNDVVTFQTRPLDRDVTFGGGVTADLQVSTTGTDADFVVKLIDVYPEDATDHPYRPDTSVHLAGYHQLVRGEIMRGRFRRSFSRPEAFRPGRQTAVTFPLQDVMHTFRRGHRIMVQVQSSWFPAFDRNPQSYVPNIYKALPRDFIPAVHRVWVDRRAPSRLRVHVLP